MTPIPSYSSMSSYFYPGHFDHRKSFLLSRHSAFTHTLFLLFLPVGIHRSRWLTVNADPAQCMSVPSVFPLTTKGNGPIVPVLPASIPVLHMYLQIALRPALFVHACVCMYVCVFACVCVCVCRLRVFFSLPCSPLQPFESSLHGNGGRGRV